MKNVSKYEKINNFKREQLNTFSFTRQSYIGKEKDKENNLGDLGVRKYDSQTGRFTSTESLYEKFLGEIFLNK